MSALAYFELFDRSLVYHTENCPFLFSTPAAKKTILFSDLMTIEGQLNKPLYHFFCWLIENNGTFVTD